MASTKSINMDSRPLVYLKKIKEKEKVAHPSNMNPNGFKSHGRPISDNIFLDKRLPDPNPFKNNHKNRPMKDERPVQPRFIVPQFAPPNK